MSEAPIIAIAGLGHTYERWGHRIRALDAVDLELSGSTWTFLVGPNGSGKSTLLKLLSGQLALQEGKVRIAGQKLGENHGLPLSTLVSVVRQDPVESTAPALTVGEHLMLSEPNGRGYGRAGRRERWRAYLASFSLDVDPEQPVHTLSGGERQLLSLLLARLRAAPVILLDEPLAAVDPVRSKLCLQALEALRESGKTLLMVTHDLEIALSRGNRVVALREGRVVHDAAGRARTGEGLQDAFSMPITIGGRGDVRR